MIQWMPEEKPYMKIHLPIDLESSIQAAVKIGRFPSLDDAMAEAARLLLHTITQ
jgi:Arc/MetJ-type ribon-helix-helix transcriptional regulator